MIRQAWVESGKVYGYRKLTDDLRNLGEQISDNRVARLASLAGIAAQVGYKRRPGRYGGKPAIVAENRLEQQFSASQPDQVWVTDITYIKTHEGWLYLCVVIDLFSRRVVGWSAQSRMTTDLALGTWLLTELDPNNPDIAFGLCDIGYPELGMVLISELQSIRLPLGLGIERDLHWTAAKTLSAYADEARKAGSIIA